MWQPCCRTQVLACCTLRSGMLPLPTSWVQETRLGGKQAWGSAAMTVLVPTADTRTMQVSMATVAEHGSHHRTQESGDSDTCRLPCGSLTLQWDLDPLGTANNSDPPDVSQTKKHLIHQPAHCLALPKGHAPVSGSPSQHMPTPPQV